MLNFTPQEIIQLIYKLYFHQFLPYVNNSIHTKRDNKPNSFSLTWRTLFFMLPTTQNIKLKLH